MIQSCSASRSMLTASSGVSAVTVEVRGPEDVRVNTAQLRDLDGLARALLDFVSRDPGTCVVIDARRAVPFKRVFDALEACRKANVRSVFFELLRMEGEHGDDRFWM